MTRWRAAGIAVVLAAIVPWARAAEGTRLDETGSGVVPVNAERLVLARGIEGQVVLQRGAAAELEFRSVSFDREDEDVPLALWTDGEAFRLEPPQGGVKSRARLTLSIPPGMKIRLELENSLVSADDIDSELTVSGRQVQVEARGLIRPAQFEIDGGAVKVHAARKAVRVGGRNLDVVLEGIAGRADVKLAGGTARLNGLQSGLQGDFNSANVVVDTVTDAVSLRFQKGKAQLARLRDGGDVALAGCPLSLDQVAGVLSVSSDSAVRINDCRATLRIDNSAGSVTGMKNDGTTDVTTHNAQVALGQIKGVLRIAGDALDVKLQQIDATMSVVTTSSSVALDLATAAVAIEIDGGAVVIERAQAQVDVKSRGGSIRLSKLRGPITVQADGELVEVDWEVLSTATDSKIVNEGGGITVRFPPSGDCRVDATSRNGRVESSLPKVVVAEDLGSAKGVANDGGGDMKTVVIQAAGDILLEGTEVLERPAEAP